MTDTRPEIQPRDRERRDRDRRELARKAHHDLGIDEEDLIAILRWLDNRDRQAHGDEPE